MKKLLLFMAAVLALGITARAADGDEFTIDNLKYKVISAEAKTASLIGYVEKPTGELTIPQTVNNFSVTSIGSFAFNSCSDLTYVTIPNSVTEIGEAAFYYCTSLTSANIPNSVTEIGNRTFNGCSSLASVTIPNSVTKIDDSAFNGCTSLTSVTIPKSVTEIVGNVFSYCSSLTEILVEEGNSNYTSVEGTLFNIDKTTLISYPAGAKASNYEIPNSVTKIGEYAFLAGNSLTSVTIPNSVTEIGMGAFGNCSNLTSVTIPNSVTEIGAWAFTGCSGLTSVTIPNSMTEIGQGAFSDCSSLTSVTIPESVTKIGDSAFSYCSALTTVYCYAINPPSISSDSFSNVNTRNVTLHVVKDAETAYQEAEVWKDFSIVADLEDQSGIEGIEADGSNAAEFFNLRGVRVDGNALTPGLYIKRQGGKATKVLVK